MLDISRVDDLTDVATRMLREVRRLRADGIAVIVKDPEGLGLLSPSTV